MPATALCQAGMCALSWTEPRACMHQIGIPSACTAVLLGYVWWTRDSYVGRPTLAPLMVQPWDA
jgi:hypothetical protein